MADEAAVRAGHEIFSSPQELASAVAGTLVFPGDRVCKRVVIDSRLDCRDAVFFALRGENVDGHSFALEAAKKKAAAVVLTRAYLEEHPESVRTISNAACAIVAVDETLAALHRAAVSYRRSRDATRIGVTGSNGKTTTKELIAAVLGTTGTTYYSRGNLNSETGLPLSVFELKAEHQYAVFEMGISKPGEMDQLVSVLEPDAAVITNIGSAHIEFFGDRDTIAREKKMVFSRFTGAQVAFIPAADRYSAFLAERVDARVVYFGPDVTPDFRGFTSLGLRGSELIWRGRTIRLSIPGDHNVSDALAAIAVGLEFGVPEGEIVAGIESVRPLFGRSEVAHGRVTCIRDYYNANPESLDAVLKLADAAEHAGPRVYVIGAMKELGAESDRAHADAVRRTGASRADRIVFFGDEFKPHREAIAELGRRARYLGEFDELVETLTAVLTGGELVLLKGSRGVALERLVEQVPILRTQN